MRQFALLGLILAACAGEARPTLDDISSDLRIESLPAGAHVTVGHQDIGPTPTTVHVQEGQTYELTVGAPGFQTQHFGGSGAGLLKNRSVELVLIPQGMSGPPPRGDDGAGLTAIAETLERSKSWGLAAEFWHRVILLAPRGPRGHRGLGSALAKLGQDEAAVREYEQYIFLDPGAPDAARVQRAIDAYRGGIVLPGFEQ